MPLSRRKFAAIAAALSLTPAAALAHREAKTHTQISWKENPGALHITHTFHMHDTAAALAEAGIIDSPDLLPLTARAKLALYTEENFNLKTLGGAPVALTLLGADFNSKSVFVFQQAVMPAAPIGLSVDCRMLRNLIPGHVNDVDISLGGPVRSARFKSGDGAKIVLA